MSHMHSDYEIHGLLDSLRAIRDAIRDLEEDVKLLWERIENGE